MAEVVVIITDVNDNSPQFLFQTYTGTVAESSPIDTTVVVVRQTLKEEELNGMGPM